MSWSLCENSNFWFTYCQPSLWFSGEDWGGLSNRATGNLWKRFAVSDDYCAWNGGTLAISSIHIQATFVSAYSLSYSNFLVILLFCSYTVVMMSYSAYQTLYYLHLTFDFAACSLAFSVEDDHSTGLYWCSCHGRIFFASLLCTCLLECTLHSSSMCWHKSTNGLLLLQVCRCISELCRHRSSRSSTMLTECKARADIPNPEVRFSLVYLIPQIIDTVFYVGNANIDVFSIIPGTLCSVGGAPAWSSCSGAAGLSDFDCKCLVLEWTLIYQNLDKYLLHFKLMILSLVLRWLNFLTEVYSRSQPWYSN